MNLKLIRLRARTMQVQQPGLAILFALPVLLTILANFLLSGQAVSYTHLTLPTIRLV